ncbi:Flavocytochrome c, partial [Ascoidea rubescens DSM 1968]
MARSNHVIVVGTGLAGLTATYELLQKKVSVTLLEKTNQFGGNSIKASSGINGVKTYQQTTLHNINDDSIDSFINDSIKSAKSLANKDLINILASNSKNAVDWLSKDLKIELNYVAQLGGHSHPRTHRGSNLPPGFAIISALKKYLENFDSINSNHNLNILKNSKVIELIKESNSNLNTNTNTNKIIGLKYLDLNSNKINSIYGPVILATGGFSADFDSEDSLLKQYRKDLLSLPSTNSAQTTGDGQKLALKVGAKLIHMDQVQIHPTGFIDIQDPLNKWKILAAEALRGVGGLLFNTQGDRFGNELLTRDKVTESIFKNFEQIGINQETDKKVLIILNESSYNKMKMNFDFYIKRGLLFKSSIRELNKQLGFSKENNKILKNLIQVNKYINGIEEDEFGRTVFSDEPFDLSQELDSSIYYGYLTPVVHFTMGGIKIDSNARVLTEDSNNHEVVLKGLYAIGEVSGGVHGANRLGGSSLLECVVFGKVAARSVSEYI